MERKQLRNTVSDLIIARSDRVSFHRLLIVPRDQISPVLANNLEFVCVDAKPDRCLVVCKQCHTVFYNETWNRPIIMKHLTRFHGIAQTDVKLKCRVRKRVQARREALKIEHASTPPTPIEHASTTPTLIEHASTPPTLIEHASTPPTQMEAAPSPSPVVKISHQRKPSQESQEEVTLPQDTEPSAPHASTTLDTDELTLTDKKPAAKKRSHRRKAGANDVPLKKRTQQKATMFEDKTNF